jgi:hypothetical protein
MGDIGQENANPRGEAPDHPDPVVGSAGQPMVEGSRWQARAVDAVAESR